MMHDRMVVILAALLHDAGKVLQRGRQGTSSDYSFTDEEKERFLPKKGEGFSHLHALYTYRFLTTEFPWPSFVDSRTRERIARIAAAHHRERVLDEDNFLKACVMEADRIAAAHDREEDSEEEKGGWRKVKSTPLDSPFLLVHSEERQYLAHGLPLTKQGVGIIGLTGLTIGDLRGRGEETLSDNEYRNLMICCNEGFKAIAAAPSFDAYLLQLLTVLEEYWSLIPSAVYQAEPTVSLFDHARLTAAVAEVLFSFYEEQRALPSQSKMGKDRENEPIFRMVVGDISGIQSFIMGLNKSQDKGASKIIRGRSFYVQALARAAVLRILDATGLSRAVLISDVGGTFSLLIPNHDNMVKRVEDVAEELERYGFSHLGGTLVPLVTISEPFTGRDLMERYATVYTRIAEALERRKRQKFRALFHEKRFFIPPGVLSYDAPLCVSCGLFPRREGKEHCEICSKAFEAGTRLPKAAYVLYERGDKEMGPSEEKGWIIVPRVRAYFSDKPLWEVGKTLAVEREGEFEKVISKGERSSTPAWWPWGSVVAYVPTTPEGDVRSLEEIAEEKAEGRPLLALFRSDVDDLGWTFSKGLKKKCLSHYAALSRMITLFWGHFLRKEMQRKFPTLYLIFGGGDDLAVVGSSEEVLDFAQVVSESFKGASFGRLTFSAGIAHFHKTYPLKKALEQAEEALQQSKREKDRVTIFGETIAWRELKEVSELAKYVEETVKETRISRGFWNRLLGYWKRTKELNELHSFDEIPPRLFLTAAHCTYDINRNIPHEEEKENLQKHVAHIGVRSFESPYSRRIVGLTYGLNRIRTHSKGGA